ncbi:S-type anion channel SLAH2-like [Zingiber officinale]|uniref:S-type anion channel SLAH2-like n=1 Tax=Zingiber officinale TaxID=94328 RepID=A0A8J5KMD2_ZINOF|nr:S-type anion channel SLAH2-like [Zingiber officinale]XP_042425584.1 S-type anion channel SLAH2-like [Zingiber officinale]KAG6482388.1 hypothetical protein ZIOFF_059019 [Zingiber officinale]
MDGKENLSSTKESSDSERLPSIFKYIASNSISGFDTTPSPRSDTAHFEVPEVIVDDIQERPDSVVLPTSQDQTGGLSHAHSISISMPSSPTVFRAEHSYGELKNHVTANSCVHQKTEGKFHSQPMSVGRSYIIATPDVLTENNKFKDKRYDSFKTWSGKFEKQISNLRGKPPEPEIENLTKNTKREVVPAHRFFDALEGPELDKLKASEVLVLPEDKKWPFLLRFPVSSFGICLGVSSQAILWKTLATSSSTSFLHFGLTVNLVLWCLSLALLGIISSIYILKIILYFEAVRREYYHPIRVNFFFAPWISCLFLAIGIPSSIGIKLHAALWYVLMGPIFLLELKIYGQWMSGGRRRLSKVANPSNHLSIVGNFVGALLGASMGLKEGPIFFFAVGLAHYCVLFVTLYQRLPTNETLPKDLHPVFFLFVAAPSVASMAWAKITGEFGFGSRIAYFIALFLYASLAVRINFFRGFRFSLAWWAYTFPMTGASIATIRYSVEVTNIFTRILSIALTAISIITVASLLTSTMVHAFVLRDLFPNDIAIAISGSKINPNKMDLPIQTSSANASDNEACQSASNGDHTGTLSSESKGPTLV